MRSGFFPFVEPGFEIDMGVRCAAEKAAAYVNMWAGSRLCRLDPHIQMYFVQQGLDPDEYTGFYVNIGLDRLVMMRYGVDDVRLFHRAI